MNTSLISAKISAKSSAKNYPHILSPYISHGPEDIFFCPEESQFYSQCLDKMVLNTCNGFTSIVEFGTGDGSPVINSLLKNQFNGLINGYELNDTACNVAKSRIDRHRLNHKYIIHNTSFFNSLTADYLIANPPYIPAINDDIYLPALHGGIDGAGITRQLLERNFPNAMLMISAYSDPVGTIEYAIANGYQVEDFMVAPMSFGYYSSEPKVKQRINELHKLHKAFYSQNTYFLAGVLFKKQHNLKADLSAELIKVMTAL